MKKVIKQPKPKHLLLNPLLLIKHFVINNGEKSHLRCHKLLYFAYKKAILKYNTFLFEEEFEAWKYGPVLRSYYFFFRTFQEDENYEKLEKYLIKKIPENSLGLETCLGDSFSVKNLLDAVSKEYNNMDTVNLIDLSHDNYWDKADLKIKQFFFVN